MYRHDGQEGGGECGRVHVSRAGRQPGTEYFCLYKNIFKKYFYNKITLLPGVRGDAAAADHE